MRSRLLLLLLLGWCSLAVADITSNLTAHWTFDEGTGTSAADNTGNGHTATLASGATWTTGKIGANAALMDGTNDIIFAGQSTAYSLSTAVTLAGWVKTSSTAFQRVFSFLRGADSTGLGLSIGEGAGGANANDGKLTGVYRNAANAFTVVRSAAVVSDNAWHHVALTITGTTATLYIDGSQDGQATDAHATNTFTLANNTLGLGYYSGSSGPSPLFAGSLDDLRVYEDRALSSTDMTELFAYPAAPSARRRVVVY